MREQHDSRGTRDLAGPSPLRVRNTRTQDERIERMTGRSGYRVLCAMDGRVLGHAVLDRLGNVDSLVLESRTA